MKTPRNLTSHGFSLIELLLVVLLLGLVLGVASFKLSVNSSKKAIQVGREFANKTAWVSEHAVINRQQWGVKLFSAIDDAGLTRYGYRLIVLDHSVWEASGDEMLFPAGVTLKLVVEGIERNIGAWGHSSVTVEKAPLLPDIQMLSSGDITMFNVALVDDIEQHTIGLIRSDRIGRIEWQENTRESI